MKCDRKGNKHGQRGQWQRDLPKNPKCIQTYAYVYVGATYSDHSYKRQERLTIEDLVDWHISILYPLTLFQFLTRFLTNFLEVFILPI